MTDEHCCSNCGGYRPNHIAAECPEVRQRGCSDCNHYYDVSTMITQKDGRVTCKTCDRAAKDKASERAQLAFFGQQSLI